MNGSMREEFETAFRTAGQFKAMSSAALDSMLERGSDGEYRSVRVHGAWWGWQASRESLVIELPSPEIDVNPDEDDYEEMERMESLSMCEHRILGKCRKAV